MTFDELGLSADLLKAIHEAGYSEPTPIQEAAIPEALKGRDVLGVAQTGTGKTASFTLPMIEMLSRGRAKARMPRSLILTPTRELAAQVAENFEKYGKYQKLSMALLIGGVSFGDQDRALTAGVDVLIATPGRLLDHFERGKLLMTGVQVLVVDEADRMLDMGFIPDIERIFQLTPFTRQTLFFSATMPPEIQRITNQFLQNPMRIEVARQSTTAETVTQWIVKAPSGDPRSKRAALRAAIDAADVKNAILFCNRKMDVDIVARSLKRHGYSCAPIHGDLPQSVRTDTLARFKANEITLLVASDVAARGLDIPDVSHVFNFDVPRHAEDYVHRIGRTGRAGRSGEAFTIVSPNDDKSLAAVETLIQKTIEPASHVTVEAPADDGTSARGKDKREDGGRRSGRSRRGGDTANGEEHPDAGEAKPARDSDRKREAAREAARDSGRARERNSGRDSARDSGPRTVGMGEHTPAFLLRPVRKATPDPVE